MSFDRTEQLIRDAFADEAARTADPREVLAGIRQNRPRRRNGLVLATAAVVVVVVAVAAFVVPEVFERSAPPAADQPATTTVAEKNVLVVGMAPLDLTDSMVLTQVRPDGAVNLVTLPRDTWAQVPGGEMTRLNGVYKAYGMDGLLATVGALTGVTPDHYVVVDMAAIGPLTTAVGGVEVCLKGATSDEHANGDFPAGRQVLAGDAALAYLRQRHGLPNGDLDRQVRLQTFLRSLALKLGDTDETRLGALLDAVDGKVTTDDDLDLLGLAVDLSRAGELRVGTIPMGNTAFETPDHQSVIQVDPAQATRYVADLPGTPPATGDVPCVW
jgi:LCP family protein required for cell wall assembly